jgi:tRNA(Arg) A34 adenosine deaminase TadA
MRATIRVTIASMERSGGGPFGALLATGTGTIISIGYNLVLPEKDSTAHAEVVAIRRAERALGTHSLRGPHLPRLRLFTTCAPCIMCVGAVHWAGIPEVVAAARASDAEAIGFVEGPRSFDAVAFLRERGIEYRADFLRDEALEIFRKYRGPVYNG